MTPNEVAEQSTLRHPSEWAVAALLLLFLLGIYSTEVADTDSWWHLKTGQWIIENTSLPDPDPFSYTSQFGDDSYEGESMVRRFNLTHEWLAQVVSYFVYSLAGFAGLSLWKAVLLTTMSGIAGLLVYRDTQRPLPAAAAVLAGIPLAIMFAADRPTIVTFAMVAVFVLLLELHSDGSDGVLTKGIWALPALALIWSNSHGGFFLGFVVLGAYSVGALQNDRAVRVRLWSVTACSIVAFALNPNGLRIIEVLRAYRRSAIHSTLIEWHQPPLWGEPYSIGIFLLLTAAVMIAAWRRVKWSHALLFVAFAAASILAFRNAVFLTFFGPWFIARYSWGWLREWFAAPSKILNGVACACVLSATIYWFSSGSMFQLRGAQWKFPVEAAEFLAQHPNHKIFNSYEYGGYLIWRLGPEQKTFIDGRALNDSVYNDYKTILYSGASAPKLLRDYGVDVVITNAFEYATGVLYPIVGTLRDSPEWALLHQDAQALVFARRSAANAAWITNNEIPKSRVSDHLTDSCAVYIEHVPMLPNCARTLGFHLAQANAFQDAEKAFELYFDHISFSDADARRALDQLRGLH